MDEIIWLVEGAILNIIDSSPRVCMIGSLKKRLILAIRNAFLHLSDVSVNIVPAFVGGKTVEPASNLILSDMLFVGNHMEGIGVALYVVNGSTVLLDGDTTIFPHTSVVGSGGAVCCWRRFCRLLEE